MTKPMEEIRRIEAVISANKKVSGKECGECSLCCKLPKIDTPEFSKPATTWCSHCRPGREGCSIYDDRPPICRGFACLWLLHPLMPDEWKPSICKMVIYFTNDEPSICVIEVDPSVPNRWREEPCHEGIRLLAADGVNRVYNNCFYETRVIVGKNAFIILPDEDVDITDCGSYAYLPPLLPLENRWQIAQFDTFEKGRKFVEFINSVRNLSKEEHFQVFNKTVLKLSEEDRLKVNKLMAGIKGKG